MLLFRVCEVMSWYVLSQRGLDVYMMYEHIIKTIYHAFW
jgi:hypothetical protein